jgi:NhaA family Na+:H+ antiporter
MDINYRNKNFTRVYSVLDFIQARMNPGLLLLVVALLTMVIANSPLRSWYESIWAVEFMLGCEHFNLFSHNGHPLTMLQLVNDTLMAIFFFSVGLEIKREIMVWELSSFRQALLPFFAACGGMIFPILFFILVGKTQGLDAMQMNGMAIPMATDIAFSLGVLMLLGKNVPISLKIFLMALAIVDDIGGLL